ncbi:hypothetical protein [Sphingobacterium faecale]|uniref:HTH cro/C1-type domain-containing protein n=1 Tax=Sphingobacterium faecale TaxID=2803775 RepID=A0ABS1QYL0_9SPHI|nr:hypothetical protein [Sphingobacterium faecale]MBL1407513.1 hypothetical protein [Sphingobacterium faecale]
MGRRINNIEEELGKTKLTAAALALYLDINESTISKWKSHTEEPAIKTVDDVGEVLEVNNGKLLIYNERTQTGLADALQNKYKELLKQGIEKKVLSKNSKGNPIMVNNPVFVQALQIFVTQHKKKHSNNLLPSPVIIEKKLADIEDKEIEGVKIFICNGPNDAAVSHQVVNIDRGRCTAIAAFNELKDAENYVDMVLRGYISFEIEKSPVTKKTSSKKK